MSEALTIGSLFSGVGGLELGLERGIGNGARTLWQVEQSEFCRAVLAKHWPGATRYEDVRDVGRFNLPAVDVLCGGFPCQDVSEAGMHRGLSGERSGLWGEYARIVGELRPRYVVVENVTGLFDRGFGDVLGSLASLGYDAEWSVVSACSVGAPHTRERVFVLGYPQPERQHALPVEGRVRAPRQREPRAAWSEARALSAHRHGDALWCLPASRIEWMVDGIRTGMEQLGAYGNAVVPQVAEVVGEQIAAIEARPQSEVA